MNSVKKGKQDKETGRCGGYSFKSSDPSGLAVKVTLQQLDLMSA